METRPEEFVEIEQDNNSYIENLLKAVLIGYKTAFNKANPKVEIDFTVTITTHKVATPDGNKDVAYLRLDRHVKDKLTLVPKEGELKENNYEDGWATKLLHQEVYFFKNIAERANPKKEWKDQLVLNTVTRLISAGLEYAELLQRLKNVEQAKKDAGLAPKTEEQQRLENIGLVEAKEMPKALTKEDEDYKKWLAEERAKEGLN